MAPQPAVNSPQSLKDTKKGKSNLRDIETQKGLILFSGSLPFPGEWSMKLVFVLLLSAILTVPVFGMEHQHASKTKSPILMSGLGNHHHPIATSNSQAQKFFDQGLTLVYGFNHAEAIRSFQRAAELDPKAAMPLWGIALALGPNYNLDVDPAAEKAAFDALQNALKLAPAAPPNERAYIEALTTRYTDDPKADLKQLGHNYSQAMRKLWEQYPDDLDAATLYAESMMNLRPWQLWTADGKPAEGTEEILNVLESVLNRDPNHVGANHYYIHAVEASPEPERALPSAERLESLVPAAGHLVHMPAHIQMRTGDYKGAAISNDRAAKIDEQYIRTTQAKGVYPAMYYNHNIHFYSAACSMQGRYADAKRSADQLGRNVLPLVKEMPMVEGFVSWPCFVRLRFHKWDEVLKLPEPDKSLPITNAAWHFARAMAFAGLKNVDQAVQEQQLSRAASKQIAKGALFGLNLAENVMKVADLVLEARIAEARGDTKPAIEIWRKAVQAEDSLSYDEPPGWFYPVRESLGGALYRDGQYQQAEQIFREDLTHHPRNPRSLFGLMESLKAQKQDSDAAWVQRQFQESWRMADTSLDLNSF
jgi:tetratricopeptide (TPR) repeat protein